MRRMNETSGRNDRQETKYESETLCSVARATKASKPRRVKI